MPTALNAEHVTCPACKGTRMMDGGGGSRIPCDLHTGDDDPTMPDPTTRPECDPYSAGRERGAAVPRKGRRIVSAALLLNDGRVILGVRHFDKVMRSTLDAIYENRLDPAIKGAVQGFYTNDYQFESREAAWLIAERAGQFDPADAPCKGTLYSEDLW